MYRNNACIRSLDCKLTDSFQKNFWCGKHMHERKEKKEKRMMLKNLAPIVIAGCMWGSVGLFVIKFFLKTNQ